MRGEKEMMSTILGVAERDERVKAVILNGSRTNTNAVQDIFMDYDIIYVVTDITPFIEDRSWTTVFGEELIFQFPDDMDKKLGKKSESTESFSFLMQFKDGNRIDLRVQSESQARSELVCDRLAKVLLDKNGSFKNVPPPTDESHWVSVPTYAQYECTANEFWWVMPYAAKGLWRGEIVYAAEHMDMNLRPQLFKMLCWHIAATYDYKISVGKCGKYLDKYAEPWLVKEYLDTYFKAEETGMWDSLLCMGELFLQLSATVAKTHGFKENKEEAQNSLSFVKHIKNLSKDAKEIY